MSSLCYDKNGIELLIKANELELLNKILENEVESYEDYKQNEDKNMFKIKDILNISEEEEENKIENYIV